MIISLIKKIIPKPVIQFYHFLLAFLGALIFGFPSFSGKIKIIGVTGTNGKTSVIEMINQILEEANFKTSLSSSLRFKIDKKEQFNTLRMTTPGRFFLQKFLKKSISSGCQYAILEITSEGIKQYRHKFIKFDIAVFTNLFPEHIESHGSFENYKKTKGQLFAATKDIHIINFDDENSNYFLQFPAKEKWLYTFGDINENDIKNNNWKLVKAKIISDGYPLIFSIDNIVFRLNLIGAFNIYNALCAISTALSQGISLETCQKALEKFNGVPGRMEKVIDQPFKVFVDYAFTPQALEKVYQTLSSNFKVQGSRLICVLGAAGGGRDKWKRPILGEIAAKYCQEIIITNEDPYDEDPAEIINQVANGAQNADINHQKPIIHKILDRRKAIYQALKIAKEGDIVVITGKGCEPSIVIKGKKIPWDDRKVAKEEYEKIKKEME
jgi:UDP-N-acetylmuramoyl-L-alanyl-D-glutamate--2,6-diaminopimelate ligase